MALFPDWVFPSTVGAWLGLLMDVFREREKERSSKRSETYGCIYKYK
eukprot:CAMPEP_0201148698 /NCGR_PEP_ID=MMETSP0851-20130426/10113_1 /ASSEMBLY_ACC=CAM_ASM_000631 /TAXON_ID=183588 /ORGANISM="Pseudo-nitzschia fraudulenta, Strain WWA7" /LENGTH=46 /DNA_ID= /DNA_START= /DNA_END= /DNA_ORIENTATION=